MREVPTARLLDEGRACAAGKTEFRTQPVIVRPLQSQPVEGLCLKRLLRQRVARPVELLHYPQQDLWMGWIEADGCDQFHTLPADMGQLPYYKTIRQPMLCRISFTWRDRTHCTTARDAAIVVGEGGRVLVWMAPALEDAGQRVAATRTSKQHLLSEIAVLRRRMAHGSAATLLDVEGGWSAVLRVPASWSDEKWALALLERDGVLVHPGFFFDFES